MATTREIIGTITGGKMVGEYNGQWPSGWATSGILNETYISAGYTTSTSVRHYPTPVCYRFEVDNNLTGWTATGLYFNAQGKSQYALDIKATFYEKDPTTSTSATGYDGGALTIEQANVYLPITYQTNISAFSGKKVFYVVIELVAGDWANAWFKPIEVGLVVSPPQLTIDLDKNTVSPNETFTLSFQNRINEKLDIEIKYNNQKVTSFLDINKDTYKITFNTNWLNSVDKAYGQFTIIASDDLERVATSAISFQLDSLGVSTNKSTVETGSSISIEVTNRYSRSLSYEVVSGLTKFEYGSCGSTFELTPDAEWFETVENTSNSMSVTVNVKDTLGRTASVSFTVTAGPEMYPSIDDITLTNVPATNMPSGYGYVAGYSKVKIAVTVTWPSIANSESVVVSYIGASNKSMSYNSSTQQYEVTVGPITGNTSFTVTVTDSNTRQAQLSKQLTGVTTLNPLMISLNSYSVNAGNSVTATVSNNVGNYSYSLKKDSTTVGSASGLSAGTFNFTTSSSWFPTDGSVIQLTIKVVVTDVLGRTAENNFTVNLPPLTISLDKTSVLIGEEIVITLGGTANQTVTLQLKCNNKVLATPTVSNNTVTVTCPKSWFTTAQVTNQSSMDIIVSATRGKYTATATFTLSFPTLGITADKTSVTAGQTIQYTFTNRESNTLTLKYNYQSTAILQQSVSANTVTITNSKTLFDTAGVKTSQSLVLTVTASDSYGRSANLSIIINASSDMAPSITSVIASIVQPSPASQTFPNTYIANVSRAKLSVEFSLNTQAIIASASLRYGSTNISMRLNSTTGKYEATTTNPLTGNTTFTIILTDQRGMSAQQTYTLSNVKAYSQPKINIQSYYRCNQNGTKNDSGEWCYLSIVYTFTSLNGQNARNTTVTLDSSTDSRTVTSGVAQTYILPADMEHSYDIVVVAVDSITSVSKTVRLSTAGVIMDFLAQGKGIGLGKVAESSNMVEINPDWELKCSVRVNGRLVDLGTFLGSLLS